ncbi:hypothetical protein HDE_03901 [Halotydeus destructor]|nr:hypothetical protein HDE_03901 [Halotydeus destructor]
MIRLTVLIMAHILIVSATFGTRGGGSFGGGYGGGGIELCRCPPLPPQTRYVAVEIPKPVRVTTIPAPNVQPNMIPVVVPSGGHGHSDGYK